MRALPLSARKLIPSRAALSALLALLALSTPTEARAQEAESACQPAPVPDLVIEATAHMNLRPLDSAAATRLGAGDRARLTLLLQAVQESFRAPASLAISPSLSQVFESKERDESPFHSPPLDGQVRFAAHADGRITDVRIHRPSIASSLDSAIVGALIAAGTEARIGALAISTSDDDGLPTADSAVFILSIDSDADTAGASHALARMHLDAFLFQRAMILPDNRAPPYPERMQRGWLEGTVLMEFIIGRDGRVEPASIRVIETTDPEFTEAVRTHLPTLRYASAKFGGCRVRMRVQQPFNFMIRR